MRPSSPLLKTITWRLPRDWPPSCLVARQTAVHRSVQSSRLGVSLKAAASASELAVNNGGSGPCGGGAFPSSVRIYGSTLHNAPGRFQRRQFSTPSKNVPLAAPLEDGITKTTLMDSGSGFSVVLYDVIYWPPSLSMNCNGATLGCSRISSAATASIRRRSPLRLSPASIRPATCHRSPIEGCALAALICPRAAKARLRTLASGSEIMGRSASVNRGSPASPMTHAAEERNSADSCPASLTTSASTEDSPGGRARAARCPPPGCWRRWSRNSTACELPASPLPTAIRWHWPAPAGPIHRALPSLISHSGCRGRSSLPLWIAGRYWDAASSASAKA